MMKCADIIIERHCIHTDSTLHTDNEYEIGEEPENTWGWGKRSKSGGSRGRRKEDGWVSKRRKKLDGMVKHCADILKRVGHGESGCGTVSVECADEAKNEAKNGAAIAVTDDCADEYDAAYDAETDSGDEIVCGKVSEEGGCIDGLFPTITRNFH